MIASRSLRFLKLSATVSLSLYVLTAAGCSSSTAQVSGKVTLKDGSAPTGAIRVIRFEPTQDTTAEIRKAAFADLEPDGSFQLFTRKPGDGVNKGRYAVTFTIFKTAMGQESLILDKYTAIATTPYTIDVDRDLKDLSFEIELK